MRRAVAVLPGDGIGPEVMKEALKVLDRAAGCFNVNYKYNHALIGGAAYDKFSNHFPEETVDACKNSEAVLFGSVGGPVNSPELKWVDSEKNSVLGLRKHFGFAVNIRPAKIFSNLESLCPLKPEIVNRGKGVDMVIIRELLGDIYFGEHVYDKANKKAHDVMEYTEEQVAVPLHFAFKTALQRDKKVTVVDKANVLDCSRLWRKVANEVAAEYPEVELEFMLVDNAAMQLIQNPTSFDVVATGNIFGDILSDAASVLPGSLGLMPSASLSDGTLHMYEPSGGSAPSLEGKNVANPIAQILSGSMMLRYSFNATEEAQLIEDAVDAVLNEGHRTIDLLLPGEEKTISTTEMGDRIADKVTALFELKK